MSATVPYAIRRHLPRTISRTDQHLIDVFDDVTEAGVAFTSTLARQLQADAMAAGEVEQAG